MGIKEDLESLDTIYKLKSTYRMSTVGKRKESSAEHTWGCLMVAELLIAKVTSPLNKLRVYELLIYHDLVEAECGDTPLVPGVDYIKKQKMELEAAEQLKKKLPSQMGEAFWSAFTEFEHQQTREARFAKLVDGFEGDTFTRHTKESWTGWTKKFQDEKRLMSFQHFPELREYYLELQKQLIKDGIYDENAPAEN